MVVSVEAIAGSACSWGGRTMTVLPLALQSLLLEKPSRDRLLRANHRDSSQDRCDLNIDCVIRETSLQTRWCCGIGNIPAPKQGDERWTLIDLYECN